jgi:hypothetical protein
MIDKNLFVVEIDELDRSNRTERLLDDMLNLRLQSGGTLKPPLESTREIVEMFLQVVRRRNNLRRNWHPQQSMRCDWVALDRLEKKGVIARVNNKLDEVISAINGGDLSKAKESIQAIKKDLNQGFSEGQADIARTIRKSPLKNEVREIKNRIDDCTFNDLLDGLRAKEGGDVIVQVHDDAVEHRDPAKPNKPPKITTYSRLRDIFTEVKRELKK